MLKCKNFECNRFVTKPGMAHCSVECAPLGFYAAKATASTRVEASTIRDAGVPCALSSTGEPRLPNVSDDDTKTKPLLSGKGNLEGQTMKPILNENVQESVRNTAAQVAPPGNGGTPNERRTDVQTLRTQPSALIGNNAATQLMEFIAPLPTTGEGKSQPTNLIDSSLNHLHDLMRQVATDNPKARTNPAAINAVCNLAKNIRELMTLKLHVVKAARNLKSTIN